jgi:hypothetical protein
MTILYPPLAKIKPSRPFGRGILRSAPVHRVDHTAADRAWWAAESARMEEQRLELMAAESAARGRLDRGRGC